MSTRDNVNNAVVSIALKTTDLNTNVKAPLLGVDTREADAAKLLIFTGDGKTFDSTDKVEWRIQHSDTTTDGDFEAVTQDDVIGVTVGANGVVAAYAAAITGGRLVSVGYRGNRRYIRAVSVKGGTITGALATVLAELTYRHQEGPVVAS